MKLPATHEVEVVTFNVSFNVNDGTDAIKSASLTIGEIEKTTGSAGGCSASLTEGEHTVIISKEGFVTKTETIIVDDEHTSFTFSLTAE